MAKVRKQVSAQKRQARASKPSLKRKGARARAQALAEKVTFTLGDLIAATVDAVGAEAQKVAKVISSRPMSAALGRRIVFV
jgi:hypothetical protein